MKIEEITHSYQVKYESELQYIHVYKDIYVFKFTKTSEIKKKKTATIQGDCREVDIKRHNKNKTRDFFVSSTKEEKQIQIVSNGFLEVAQKKGYSDAWDKKKRIAAPFDMFLDKKITKDNFILSDWSSYMIFDLDGSPLPCAIYMDYIEAGLSNGRYDLVKAKKILEKRNDIDGLILTDVPYYNCSSGCSKYIRLIWQPSKKDYQKMWEKCLSYKTQWPSTTMAHAIFDLDLLGLRKGGAAYFDEFYKSKEDEDY